MNIAEEKFKTSTSYLLPFEKIHGLGNDFVIVNNSHLPEDSNTQYEQELSQKICARNLGIGADGLIIIDAPKESENSVRSWRFYNSDGSIPEMCGNGIRCAAKYIYEHGLSGEETNFKIETLIGDIDVQMLEEEQVKVNMGTALEIKEKQKLSVDSFDFDYDFISMGNPHAVSFFDLSSDELKKLSQHGAAIEIHSDFPNKTNVEFARKVDDNTIELIVWERGCGFTQACGTGACATAVAGILRGLFAKDQNITVKLPGGDLSICWDSVTDVLFMTGPAEMTFVGYFNA